MATNSSNSITTRSYIAGNICTNAFITDLKKCPTKNEINSSSRFISVKTTLGSQSTVSSSTMISGNSYHYLSLSGTTNGTPGRVVSNYISGNLSMMRAPQMAYNTSSVKATYVGYYNNEVEGSDGTNLYNNCCAKYSVTCGVSRYCELTFYYTPAFYTSISSSASNSYVACNGSGRFSIYILDANKKVITYTSSTVSGSSSRTFTMSWWSPTKNSTNYICIVPYNYQWSFTPIQGGANYVWVGYYMYGTFKPYTTYYASNQCVPYGGISTTKSFTMNYSIYNTNKSAAKVDTIEVDYSTSTSPTSGTWTSMGSKSISSVASGATATGFINCTLPSSISLTTSYGSYRFRVKVGTTVYNQKWEYHIDGGNWVTHSTSSKTGISAAYYIFPPASGNTYSLSGRYNNSYRINTVYFRIS